MIKLVRVDPGIKRLLETVVVSAPSLANVGCLLFLIMYIYAILGVSFFRAIGTNGTITMQWGSLDGWHTVELDATTDRGIPFGEEYFGNFGRALRFCGRV